MPNVIRSYDGSIISCPQRLVCPKTIEELQNVVRDSVRFPSPVRAMGHYHSLTPCASSDGTIVDMTGMNQILEINESNLTMTAQAGVQILDAAKALRNRGLQMMLNIEIGNMTLGSAACCHSKDALDGIEFGQVSSYVTRMRWVRPDGALAEASEHENPEMLRLLRTSYGLCGIICEVTLQVKPLEALHLSYLPRPVDELTPEEVDNIIDSSEGLICWTVGRTVTFQQRHQIATPGILSSLMADVRRRLWDYEGAHLGQFIDRFIREPALRDAAQRGDFDVARLMYSTLHLCGGITLLAPDKIIDYSQTPETARYAFTFWAFPRAQWLSILREYLNFADQYFAETGFRCNMPLGSYHIRQDASSLLSYSQDGEIISIDPIHASTDNTAWHAFLAAFNDFAFQRGGFPLLNQSPLVERRHVEAAYGQRWAEFSDAVCEADPKARMLNPFFSALLNTKEEKAAAVSV